MLQGIGYVKSHHILIAVVAISLTMHLFLYPYVSMVPVIADDLLNIGPGFKLGILQSAAGIGALTGAIVLASIGNMNFYGRIFILGAILTMFSLLIFSFSAWYELSFSMLIVLGIGTAIFGTMQATLIMILSSEEVRGKVLGVITLIIGIGPLGTLSVGAVADIMNASFALGLNAIFGIVLLFFIVSRNRNLFNPITNVSWEIEAIPTSTEGQEKLIEKRKRYFDDKMNQYSKKILEYLQKNKVTDLVISKNLSFTKTTGEIKMNKKTKQKFYQIPFGKLLNMIEEKSPMHNIFVHKEDEGYTSKTSCLSSDVNQNQEKKSKNEPILPNDLNGNRGSKGKKLSRGLFRDTVLNIIINSDLNGAANHIRLAFDKVRITDLKNYLWKLQQPKKIKSVFEFNCFLSN